MTLLDNIYLRQRHFGDYGQHDFLAFGRIWVFLVFVEPGFQRGRGLPGGVLASLCKIVASAVSEKKESRRKYIKAKLHFLLTH